MTRRAKLHVVWIDTLCEYPIYGELTDTRFYHSRYDVALPLAAVYLKSYINEKRPDVAFTYHPRRLYEAQGRARPLVELVADGDVVLTSCSTADSVDARRILSAAKAAGRTTVIGGIYARFSAHDILEWGVADYVCTGEGEEAIICILDEIAGRSEPGGRHAGVLTPSVRRSPSAKLADLALLPEPDYSSFPMEEFSRYMNSAYMMATRGCPAPCHFCTSARLYGFSYRTRPVDMVVRELRQLFDYGFRKITLADDTVLVDVKWAEQLFAMLALNNPGYRLKIRARADELSYDLLSRMVDAGVEVVQFGVESIHSSTRTKMHKDLSQEAIEQAFNLILDFPDLIANPLYMLAYPGETWSNCHSNAEFIKQMGAHGRVLSYLSFTTPYPGTGFSKTAKYSNGIILTHDLRYYTNKFPVYIPGEMLTDGARIALERLVQCYDDIAFSLNKVFPLYRPIPDAFFLDLSFGEAVE